MRRKQPVCYIAIRDMGPFQDQRATVEKFAKEAGYETVLQKNAEPISLGTFEALADYDSVIAERPESLSANELNFLAGLFYGRNVPAILISAGKTPGKDLRYSPNLRIITYPSGRENVWLQEHLKEALDWFRHTTTPTRARFSNDFVVDWDILERQDTNNLCFELLTQLGFRNVTWRPSFKYADITAELQKSDPDGFEYKELWFVVLDKNSLIFPMIDMIGSGDRDFALRRLLGPEWYDSERSAPRPYEFYSYLIIGLNRTPDVEYFEERLSRTATRKGDSSLRVRIWTRDYLTSLVYRFPQIGFKYFSEHGRSTSKYRKSPEELYRENVTLTNDLTRTVKTLEEEQARRIRAERDAVWKDISFAAAHKIGNPIFSLETFIDPLRRRIREERTTEAIEVIDKIEQAIERAKDIIEQFKSLAKAHNIDLKPMSLRPLLESMRSDAVNKGILCKLDGSLDIEIIGDSARLMECLDEMVANSQHWFDKPTKSIQVDVSTALVDQIPPQLDDTQQYVLIDYRDNGSGIKVADKGSIFNAFFTTRLHGTGLGLAMVRQIIEGHKGEIREVGVPGEGADFQIFIPLAGPLAGEGMI